MADLKISQLTAITTLTPATDVLPVVDVTGTTKKITTNQLLGSGGTATLASATITGDLTVDTSTLKVDSANNRVGILTATPRSGFALDVLGNVALGNSTTTTSNRLKLDCSGTAGNVAVMSFAAAGTNKAFFGLSGGFLGDASTDAMVATDAAGAAIRFYVSDTAVEVARFNSTGNLAFANGKGIDFSAVTGGTGTATANVLNDYEEGTWTPVLRGSSVAGSYSFSFGVGKYTKIGRLVMVNVSFVDVTEITTGTGVIQITGLPFQIPNDDPSSRGVVGELLIRQCNSLSTAKNMYVQGSAGSSTAYFNYFNGTDDVQVPIGTIVSGQTDFGFTLTYNV